jgi:hypothetical protein
MLKLRPIFHAFVFILPGIHHDFQEFSVAALPADIFRRCAALTHDAGRVVFIIILEDFLESSRMDPAIAKDIAIDHFPGNLDERAYEKSGIHHAPDISYG